MNYIDNEKPKLKAIPGYDGYYVSDEGDVYSSRTRSGKTDGVLHKLKPSPTSTGYLGVALSSTDDPARKQHTLHVHRLVAEAFIPNPNNLPEVNHKRGNKHDNRVSELEWVTQSGNIQHALDTGLNNTKGEHNPSAKLTLDQVREIRAMHIHNDPNFGNIAIAKRFNIDPTTVSDIIRGKTWADDDYIPKKLPRTKITMEEVREIRELYIPGDPVFGCTALAKRYGISQPTVSEIIRGTKRKEEGYSREARK